jgi:RimJ/RimL family protein N-acetyltransferase
MSKPFKINDELSIYIVKDVGDSLLHKGFFTDLYNNVFSDEENNIKAGIKGMNTLEDVISRIKTWLGAETSPYMFFLFKGNDVIGTTQAFRSRMFDPNTLSLGYIVSPSHQGKGYGTIMLKFVSEYLHSDKL